MVSADAIIQAARDEGIADFSMLAIAKRLSITHGALYRYFPSRDELAVAVIDDVIEGTMWDCKPEGWRDLLLRFAQTLWSLSLRTPGFAASVLSLPRTPPSITQVRGAYVSELGTRGIHRDEATVVVELISDEVLLTAQLLARNERSDGGGFAQRPEPTSRGWVGDIGLLDRKIDLILEGAGSRLHS